MTETPTDRSLAGRRASKRGFLGALAAAAPLGAAVALPAPPAAAAVTAGPFLSVRDFGAAGDGRADDSGAFDAALAEASRAARPLLVPAGRYRVPDLRPSVTTAPLVLVGEGRELTVLDAGFPLDDPDGPLYWLGLNAGLTLRDIGFRGFTNVVALSDGSNTPGASDGSEVWDEAFTTGTVGDVTIERCGFEDCRRPIIALLQGEGVELSGVRFVANVQKGGWSGPALVALRLRDLLIADNTITLIDSTPAGLSKGGNPITHSVGRAIQAGVNNLKGDEGDERLTGSWRIEGNLVRGVVDHREAGPDVAPEVHGIDVRGATGVIVANNRVRDIGSAAADECEGIYAKVVEGVFVHNRLHNAGTKEGALVVKGTSRIDGTASSAPGRRNLIAFNTVRADDGYPGGGIVAFNWECDVVHNHLFGVGRDHPDSAAIKISSAYGVRHVRVADNLIAGCKAPFGIAARCGGAGPLVIEGNDVSGVTGEALSTTEDVELAGIAYERPESDEGGPLEALIIRDNVIGAVAKPEGAHRRAIAVKGDGAKRVTINGNLMTATIEAVIGLTGDFGRLEVAGNDVSAATVVGVYDAKLTSVAAFAARDNAGWLDASADWEPGEVPAGGRATGAIEVKGARPGDLVLVAAEGDLAGGLATGSATKDDAVRLALLNPTGEAIRPEAGRFRVELRRAGLTVVAKDGESG